MKTITFAKIVILHILCFMANPLFAQITQEKELSFPQHMKFQIIGKLMEFHTDKNGRISNLKVSKAFLGVFKEEADYGPMWHGKTVNVNQNGFLITWEYDKYDYKTDRSKVTYRANDWHSSERLFIPYNKSAYFRMYTCSFGGIPPSHGFANRYYKWDSKVKGLMDILKICIKK